MTNGFRPAQVRRDRMGRFAPHKLTLMDRIRRFWRRSK
jgi:hypothetical protein